MAYVPVFAVEKSPFTITFISKLSPEKEGGESYKTFITEFNLGQHMSFSS